MPRILLLALFLVFAFKTPAQDTLRILQYNLLYYGTFPQFCPREVNDPDKKDKWLKTIIEYTQPDVFCVNELGAGSANAQRILDSVLNTGGETRFRRCLSTNLSGSSIVNMLYYNSEKLVLHSQAQVARDSEGNLLTRVIDLYKLYHKDPMLQFTNDTTFVTFIVAHLKAGSGSAEQLQRAKETGALMDYLAPLHMESNYVFSGDFNVRSSSETSFQNLVSHPQQKIRFYDPLNKSGAWHNNTLFSSIHTQSTRVTGQTNNGCFAGGGSDDRFDFILVSEAVKEARKKVAIVPGSYQTPGQDGLRFKGSLIEPVNQSAPVEVITALYEMSDHYPVMMSLKIGNPVGIEKAGAFKGEIHFVNPVRENLEVKLSCTACEMPSFEVVSITGKVLSSGVFEGTNENFTLSSPVAGLAPGMYLLKVADKKQGTIFRKFVKG
jgi:exonuclease III